MRYIQSKTLRTRAKRAVLAAGLFTTVAGCQEWLDVNTNPNAPETVAANLYLPPMLHWMAAGQMWDGRFIGHYTQQWISTSTAFSPARTWGHMGYDPGSDNSGQQWRDVYWSFGQNLIDMMEISRAEQRWDILGVGYILKAWGWQQLADLHGEIIVKEAIDQTRFTFNYDSQEYAYAEVRRLLDSAIVLLQRTDGAVDPAYLARGDKIYNGDRTKWLKFAYGLLAINLSHYSLKPQYDPAAVIAAVNNSFTSNADDALMFFPASTGGNDDRNFLGQTRGLFTLYRQTRFVVELMDGTQFGGAVDPRLSRMLSPSPDSQYRGVESTSGFPGSTFSTLAVTQRPNNPYGYPGTLRLDLPGKYLFDDKVKHPIMTYAQLQFIKAEAAYHANQRAVALTAYTNAISAHIDFVNARMAEGGQTWGPITAAEKAAFLSNPEIVPTAANLTLTHILSQKYIAQWAWSHNELWTDMRRYHYTDVDPASGRQVFPGFTFPPAFYTHNAGKPVYRLRPRFNSEYVWNRESLDVIGGLADDFHTVMPWIFTTEP